jgi:Spy/CpxP family protein refolding chaperone
MKTFLKSLLLFACACLASLALNAADLTGVWQAEFDTQIGKQRYLFEFKADGTKLTGKATGQIGDEAKRAPVEIQEGKIDGEEISFVEPFEFQGNALRIT